MLQVLIYIDLPVYAVKNSVVNIDSLSKIHFTVKPCLILQALQMLSNVIVRLKKVVKLREIIFGLHEWLRSLPSAEA